jgi:serine/threonine-protein kinase
MTAELDAQFVTLQTVLAGRYSLERELGRGGMGIVYLARDVSLDRPVALKVLPPTFAVHDSLRQRFLREAQTAAKLSHPHIIPIYAVEELGDVVFFAMAYVDGETLRRRVERRGPLPAADVLRILREVAWALGHAHAQGVVHRDVKPDNILLEAPSGRALIGDFGIARTVHAGQLTGAGELLGTPEFMSPEQAAGEALDGRSDLYSLGIVGYFALSGRLPFQAPTVAAVLAQHLTKPPPPVPSSVVAPKHLTRLIKRLLAKDPGGRFESAAALTEALDRAGLQSTTLPVPLRMWLAGGDKLSAFYGVWAGSVGTLGALVVYSHTHGLPVLQRVVQLAAEVAWAWTWLKGALVSLAAPLPVLAGLRLLQTRRLLAQGYQLEDIRLAVKSRLEQRREERAYQRTLSPPRAARVLRTITFATGALTVGCALEMIIGTTSGIMPSIVLSIAYRLYPWSALATLSGAVTGWLYPGRRPSSKDYRAELPFWFWRTAAGRLIERIAGVGLGARRSVQQPTQRPTEAVIALEADALFQALPPDTRRQLQEVPALLRHLEAHAARIRQRIGELADLESEASSMSAPARDLVPGRALIAHLHSVRETARRQLTEVVMALETIRLDLLRLRSGFSSLDTVTADIAAAREVGAQIDRLLESQREVEEELRRDSLKP